MTRPRAHRASNLRARPTQRKKKRFSKRPQLCSPNAFSNLKTQFRQKFELLKVENSDTQKRLSSKTVRRTEAFKSNKRSRRGRTTRNRSETPCFVAFRASTSSTFLRQARRAPRGKKGLKEGWPKKCAKCLENGIFLKSPISRILAHTQFCAKKTLPISRCKTSGFRRPGPLINSSRPAY